MARPKKTIDPEEQKNILLQRELKCKTDRIYLIPEPTYFFEVGDAVHIGNLLNPVVQEVLFDSKLYRIKYSVKHNNYGNSYIEDNLEQYVWWYQIRPISTNTESLFVTNNMELNYLQRRITNLLDMKYEFGTNINPEYQRDHVWEEADKIALIDAIFNGIDIGKFVFIHNGYTEDYMYDVLDGKQRFTAICDFFENRFPYKGKFFNELSVRDQNLFRNFSISCAEVRNISRKQAMEYFVRLNSNGRIMDSAHLDKVRAMIEEFSE